MPKHVLVALPLSDAQRSALQASVPEYEFIFAQTETVTLAQVLEADIIMGNVPVELICQNHHLEWFQSNFAGPDTYLVPGVLPEHCLVTNATGAYGLAISEWMLGLWLGLQKDLFLYRDRQTQHKWDAITRQVRPVAGSRVLCVGMGDIGSNFAMRAHALGAEVVGVRRSVRPGAPCPDYCLRVVPQSELDAELPQADLVALSLPGTPETLHMFDAARLARCKQGAILLNVGRGSTVDCLALADAVHSGHLFGAALDVTDPEPLPSDHPLWNEPNVIITPHISGRFSLAITSSCTLPGSRWTTRSAAPPTMSAAAVAASGWCAACRKGSYFQPFCAKILHNSFGYCRIVVFADSATHGGVFMLYQLFWLFLAFSFLGWCLEVAATAVRLGQYRDRGVLHGPLCPVYGITGCHHCPAGIERRVVLPVFVQRAVCHGGGMDCRAFAGALQPHPLVGLL